MGIKELKEIWPGILQYMREEYDISDVSFRTWLDPLLIYSCDGRKIILIVSDTVTRDYLQKRYHKMLQVAKKQDAIAEYGSVVALTYVASQRTFFGWLDRWLKE